MNILSERMVSSDLQYLQLCDVSKDILWKSQQLILLKIPGQSSPMPEDKDNINMV